MIHVAYDLKAIMGIVKNKQTNEQTHKWFYNYKLWYTCKGI